jgi:hypothetical protein
MFRVLRIILRISERVQSLHNLIDRERLQEPSYRSARGNFVEAIPTGIGNLLFIFRKCVTALFRGGFREPSGI